MTVDELKEVIGGIAPVVREYVQKSVDSLALRLVALEQKAPISGSAGPSGPQGEKGDTGQIGERGNAGPIGPQGPQGEPGRQGDPGLKGDKGEPGDVGDRGEPGAVGHKGDPGSPGQQGDVGPVGPMGQKGDQGVAGKDVDQLQLKSLQDEVTRLREELIVLKSSSVTVKDGTPGRDGRDVDMRAINEMIDARVAVAVAQETQKAVSNIVLPPAPAVGIVSAFIDHEGELVLTMSDGSTKNVGIVKGRDGAHGVDGKDAIGRDGKDGTSVDVSVVKSMVVEAVAAIPKPKDGTDGTDGKDGIGRDGVNGKDGADGLSFTDAEFISRGPRGITVKLKRGDLEKSFDWDAAIPAYIGTFEVGKSYEAGDMVTRQGSVWFCKTPTYDLPGDGAKAWQLCVKRGSPGQKGDPGPVGATGKPGVDLTQMDNAGGKW